MKSSSRNEDFYWGRQPIFRKSLSVDVGTAAIVAALVGASATVILAVAVFSLVSQNKRQVQALTKQSLILKSQQQPLIIVKDFAFDHNSLRVTLQNAGNGIASSVVLDVMFMPAEKILTKAEDDLQPISPKEFAEAAIQGKQVYARFPISERPLKYKGRKALPSDAAFFLYDKTWKTPEMLPGQIAMFTTEIQFWVRFSKSPKPGDFGKMMSFEETKEFLKTNNVSFMSALFAINGKDSSENPIQGRGLCSFTVDFAKHASLEEASRWGYEVAHPLYLNEVISSRGWMDGAIYRNTTSQKLLYLGLGGGASLSDATAGFEQPSDLHVWNPELGGEKSHGDVRGLAGHLREDGLGVAVVVHGLGPLG